jgi:hypothetical protein
MKNSLEKQKNDKKIYFKRQLLLTFMFIFLLSVLTACQNEPILAYFADGTSAGSDNYTINVDFLEDNRFKDNYVDILLKSDIDNLTLDFKKEFDENLEITINQKEKWYSLTQLIVSAGSEEEFEKLIDKIDMTLVIKSEQDAKLKLKAVCGDKHENSQGETMLINLTNISDEFVVDLGKNIDK